MTSLLRSVLLVILILAVRQCLLAQSNSIVVVANSSVSVPAIAEDDLREIFLGNLHSLSDGSKAPSSLAAARSTSLSSDRIWGNPRRLSTPGGCNMCSPVKACCLRRSLRKQPSSIMSPEPAEP